MQIKEFQSEENAGERIDKFLTEKVPELSRSYIQKLIKEKNVKVNSVKVDSVTLSWNALTAVSNKGKFTKVSTVKNAKKTTFLDKKVSSKKRIIIRYAHIKL